MLQLLPLLLFLSTVLPVPVDTPIPCLICTATQAASATTFSGIIAGNERALRVYNAKTLQTIVFDVPGNFHGVQSGDGVIKNATLARATPGLLVQVTYTSTRGRNVASNVLLLTVAQCRQLAASERLDKTRTECPD